jgi:excisionase family DNA binding protein
MQEESSHDTHYRSRSAAQDLTIGDLVEALAQRVAELVTASNGHREAAPRWLTIEEASAHLRLTVSAARARAWRGQLPGAVKDGSRWVVDGQALDAAMSTLESGASNPTPLGPERKLDALNTIAEVAVFAKVSQRTIQRAITAGGLNAVRAGAHVRIRDVDVWAWMERGVPDGR